MSDLVGESDANSAGGGVEAFAALWRHRQDLISYVRKRGFGTQDAEDIVSEAYETALKRSAKLPSDQSGARAWLFTTTRHLVMKRWRSQDRLRAALHRLRVSREASVHQGRVLPPMVTGQRKGIAGLVIAMVVVTSCGGDDGAEDGVSGGELDDRVVEAVLPVSGESVGWQRWMMEQQDRLRAPLMRACLEDRGAADEISSWERAGEANRDQWVVVEFPEPERLREDGFGAREVAEEPTGALRECSRDVFENGPVEIDRMEEIRTAVEEEWFPIVREAYEDSDLADEESSFGECLVEEGGVPEELASEEGFFEWTAGRTVDPEVSATPGQYDEDAWFEDARLFADCGEDLFAARTELLEERRPEYIEKHRDQLLELSELVAEIAE